MARRRSIAGTVARLHVTGQLVTAVVVVLVGALAAGSVVVRRDDASAVALARTLGTELQNHRADPRPALAELVDHELGEQRWFGRHLEVWLDELPLGGGGEARRLAPWRLEPDACRFAEVTGVRQRVCTVEVDPRTVIVAAVPVAPMLDQLWPFVTATTTAALMAAAILAVLGRRRVHQVLQPLERFERAVSALPPLTEGPALPSAWGADEVDVLAATFNGLLARIRRAVEQEHRFVADAAHELRTPLTRLRGRLELAQSDAVAGRDPAPELDAAVRTCEQLSRTVEALLALARDALSADEAVDLGDVASEVLERLPDPERTRVGLDLGVDTVVRGDEALLRLAVSNLVENALKYTTGEVEVVVRRAAGEGDVAVQVADRGPGIADDLLGRVRGAFVRGAPGPRRVDGVGLGLALVDHVVRIHRGALDLVNRADGGLVAALRLPPWSA